MEPLVAWIPLCYPTQGNVAPPKELLHSPMPHELEAAGLSQPGLVVTLSFNLCLLKKHYLQIN